MPSKAMIVFWSLLPPRAMSGFVVLLQLGSVLTFMAPVTIEGHLDVHGLCCHLKPY